MSLSELSDNSPQLLVRTEKGTHHKNQCPSTGCCTDANCSPGQHRITTNTLSQANLEVNHLLGRLSRGCLWISDTIGRVSLCDGRSPFAEFQTQPLLECCT